MRAARARNTLAVNRPYTHKSVQEQAVDAVIPWHQPLDQLCVVFLCTFDHGWSHALYLLSHLTALTGRRCTCRGRAVIPEQSGNVSVVGKINSCMCANVESLDSAYAAQIKLFAHAGKNIKSRNDLNICTIGTSHGRASPPEPSRHRQHTEKSSLNSACPCPPCLIDAPQRRF